MPDPGSSTDTGGLWASVKSIFGGRQEEPTLRESLEEAIDEHESDGQDPQDLSATERTMLKNLLHFGERVVGDVAVPRSDIVAFDVAGNFATLVEQFREAGHSRMPVFEGSLDRVIGMIHVKDVYARIAETFDDAVSSALHAAIPPRDLLRDVLFVPESMNVLDLLARMRQARTHMAVVVDEYGGTDGLVTIEDLVEEIVGEIEDEYDDAEEVLLHEAGVGVWEADARLPLTDLEAVTGQGFDDEAGGDEVDTVGGLVFVLAGRVPTVGETVAHPGGWRFEVVGADASRVTRVRVRAPEPVAQ